MKQISTVIRAEKMWAVPGVSTPVPAPKLELRAVWLLTTPRVRLTVTAMELVAAPSVTCCLVVVGALKTIPVEMGVLLLVSCNTIA